MIIKFNHYPRIAKSTTINIKANTKNKSSVILF